MSQTIAATPVAELSDEAVVERVRGGDVALYEILVRRHNQRLYRTIRAILRDDKDVEDVMQQVYVDAYLHLDQFRGTAKFATWLTRIAVNRAIRTGQGERRQLALVSRDADADFAIEYTAAPGLDPEHAMYGHELKTVLESLVDDLPDPFRVVFVMREVEGLSLHQTAVFLGIPVATVKSRDHRARALLRAALGDEFAGDPRQVLEFLRERCDRLVARVLRRLMLL